MKQFLIFVFSFFFFSLNLTAQTIERVEPPNWWVGMQHNTIQMMVYGEDVQSLSPEVKVDGVSISNVKKVSNSNYLFFDLSITEQVKAGDIKIKFKKGKKSHTTIKYQIFARNKARAEMEGFDNSDAIYLITPDRFANGDSSNDNVAGLSE
ncbi:MAG: cyclomaltodextrinase N-terminal domain-containing protein, partial [Bacteroidota bacterium]